MHITLVSTGSRGDVQPYVALGVALKQAGHHVRLALPENFQAVVTALDIDYSPVRGDWQQILQSEVGQQFMSSGANLIRVLRAIQKMMAPIVDQMGKDAWAAALGADALLCHSPVSMFGQSVSERLGIPLFSAEPVPLLVNRAMPSPMFPIQRNLGGVLNAGTTHLMRNIMFQMFRTNINQLRTERGLARYGARAYFRHIDRTPTLEAYSTHVVPRAPEWGENVHVTGYWFLDEPDWQPPETLLDFLGSGQPPVYVGFGSMSGDAPENTTRLVFDAIASSGMRAVIGAGWGGIQAARMPDNLYFLDSAPHSWLFPHMSAVVHHGGSGTTAAGLRAGVPSVIIPHLADQFFWGKRVYELGVGSRPIPRKTLTAENLASALRGVTDPAMRQRAADLGAKIRAEDGVGSAVRLIERYVQ